jgi:Zn-dependent protease with chaperone function
MLSCPPPNVFWKLVPRNWKQTKDLLIFSSVKPGHFSMKYSQYISLIQKLEVSAAKNRSLYQFKVFLLTILGYAYFVGLILSVLVPIGVVGWLVWMSPAVFARLLLFTAKFWWALIPGLGLFFGFIGSAIKSITAKVPDPEGSELTRAEAPELFDFVERTCANLQSKKPEKILITDNFNAAVVTMPRFGIFGQKVLLLIGLPIMKALSPEQFKAVLAHEIGHISGKHGAFAKWAYQMRESWGRLIDSQAVTDHKFASLYKGFVDWFFPYFTAYSFVLMREHEKDADRDAARIVGSRPLGEALILLETKGRVLEDDFWRGVHQENISNEMPTEQLFTRMLGILAFVDEEQSVSSLSKAVSVPTDFNDTHPALADRLRLFGYWTSGDLPDFPAQSEIDAARLFLGEEADGFTSQFDARWDEQAAKEWKTRHDHFQESQKRVLELEEKRSGADLSLEELREMARRLTEKDGIAAAMPVIEEAAEKFPEDGVVWYNLGLARLSQEDERGLADLDKAGELDSTLKLEANQLAFGYLRGKGRLDEARAYATYIDEQNEIIEKAQKERAAVFPEDKFLIHELPDEFIEKIPQKLAGLEEISAVYAVRKDVEYFPERPFHVLFIEIRKKGRIKNRHDGNASVIFKIARERLDTGEIHYFVTLAGKYAGTKHYLDKIPGARVYEKPR